MAQSTGVDVGARGAWAPRRFTSAAWRWRSRSWSATRRRSRCAGRRDRDRTAGPAHRYARFAARPGRRGLDRRASDGRPDAECRADRFASCLPVETEDPDRLVAPVETEKPKPDDPSAPAVPTTPSVESAAVEATATPSSEMIAESTRSDNAGAGNRSERAARAGDMAEGADRSFQPPQAVSGEPTRTDCGNPRGLRARRDRPRSLFEHRSGIGRRRLRRGGTRNDPALRSGTYASRRGRAGAG